MTMLLLLSTVLPLDDASLVAKDAKVEKLADGFKFTEGPAVDADGNVYFTDIPNNRIHLWTTDGKLSTFREDSGGSNGLFIDAKGNLLCCEGTARRLTLVNIESKEVTVLADKYDSKKLNSPNDLWIDPKGGVYFTDPRYGREDDLEQDGFHVYYLSPDRKKLTRVIADMKKPNGIVGTPDGKTLYVTDPGARKTYSYTINSDASLADKKLVADEGSDGMTLDNQGNLYLTNQSVKIYDPKKAVRIGEIKTPEAPANVCFGGKDRNKLFITARTGFYSIDMNVKAADAPKE